MPVACFVLSRLRVRRRAGTSWYAVIGREIVWRWAIGAKRDSREPIIIAILILGALGYLGWHAWRKARGKSCHGGSASKKPRETSTRVARGGRSA